MNQVDKKVAIVTGASRGIGAATAIKLASAGFSVAIHYRTDDALAQSIQAECPGSVLFKYDLSQPESCKALIDDVKGKMGSVDILVNNAGITRDALLAFAKPEDFDALISTNLRPIFLLSKYAGKLMMRKKWGRIINISSVIGFTGNPGQSLYASVKSGIVGFSRSAAQELAHFGILVNCVAPGFIVTDMTEALADEAKESILSTIPLKKFGSPMDVANAVAFLASDEAGYITGSTIHVNGGMYTP